MAMASSSVRTAYLLQDERMALHRPVRSLDGASDAWPFERPERILRIRDRLSILERDLSSKRRLRRTMDRWRRRDGDGPPDGDSSSSMAEAAAASSSRGGDDVFLPLECRPASRHTIELAHSPSHYDQLRDTSTMTDDELHDLTASNADVDDVYFGRDTFRSATLAAGGLVRCVDAVLGGGGGVGSSFPSSSSSRRAVAVVRPPGHHACRSRSMGFCYFNSVAIAAKHAVVASSTGGKAKKRVLILDWDVHHGNGTQDLTYDDPDIFYVSLHRIGRKGQCDSSSSGGYFFPGTGDPSETGGGKTKKEVGTASSSAEGTNLNVGWTARGMGNVEYAAAFSELVLPLLASYTPDLVLISCGFDAARGDPIGDCDLTPDMYHCMTRAVIETAGSETPIVVALEGGYDLDVVPLCMEAVALALLDEPWNEKDAQLRTERVGRGQSSPDDDATWNDDEGRFDPRHEVTPIGSLSNITDNDASMASFGSSFRSIGANRSMRSLGKCVSAVTDVTMESFSDLGWQNLGWIGDDSEEWVHDGDAEAFGCGERTRAGSPSRTSLGGGREVSFAEQPPATTDRPTERVTLVVDDAASAEKERIPPGVPPPPPHVRPPTADDRLRAGRACLSDRWDRDASNPRARGLGCKKTAIRNINRSLKAIKSTDRWKDRPGLDLREVPQQNEVGGLAVTRTRRRGAAAAAAAAAQKESVDTLSASFGEISMG